MSAERLQRKGQDELDETDKVFSDISDALAEAANQLEPALARKHRLDQALVEAAMAKAMIMNGSITLCKMTSMTQPEAFSAFQDMMRILAARMEEHGG